jgi:ketosteroid isomerase-like protein
MEGTPSEIVVELYRIWREEGIEAAMPHVSPDIEWVEPFDAIGRESRQGRDDALAGYESWAGSYEGYGGDILEVEENGERVLVHFMQRGTPRGGSVPVEGLVYQLWTVRDEKPIRMQMFMGLDDARAALYS